MRKLKPWHDSRGKYLMICLCNNGETRKKLVHRLVAEAFIENKYNYKEVNHKNYITDDNRVENLEWCNRQQNINHALEKYSPIHNFKECKLYHDGKFISEHISISDAARTGSRLFGASKSGLIRNRKSKNVTIIA